MDKNQFSKILRIWLENFLKKKVLLTHEILEVIIPETAISKLNNEHIKQIANYSSWEVIL